MRKELSIFTKSLIILILFIFYGTIVALNTPIVSDYALFKCKTTNISNTYKIYYSSDARVELVKVEPRNHVNYTLERVNGGRAGIIHLATLKNISQVNMTFKDDGTGRYKSIIIPLANDSYRHYGFTVKDEIQIIVEGILATIIAIYIGSKIK